MNLVGQSSESNSNLLFVNFNQDCSSFAVGTKTGYRLYSLASIDKIESIYEHEGADICMIDRLFSSSLVAIVSLSSPRKLKVCHFKKGTEICSYSYSNTILAAKLNRLRLIVCLEESLYIHNIRDMKVLYTIRDTASNPNGICAVSTGNEGCYLAYPANNKIGEVQIFDAVTLKNLTMIAAHDNPIAALAFNSTGNRMASASEKVIPGEEDATRTINVWVNVPCPEGTVIRVFSVPDGQKLFEFRRGVKRCATIHSLAFSPDSLFVSCTSNTETVHVFRLETPEEKVPDDSQSSWMGYFGAALKTSANYLPSQVTEMLNQGRDFATARLPFSGLKSICAITCIQKMPRLLVAAEDGFLYVYNLDPVEGGECILLKQHRMDGQMEGGGSQEPSGGLLATAASGPRSSPISYAASVRPPSESGSLGSNGRQTDSPLSAPGFPDHSAPDHTGMGNLNLDDDNEFPPVCHTID